MPYIGVSPFNGVRKKHTYTATASQTSFSGAGTEGITLSYKDSTFVDVYQNGVKLGEADYTSTSGTAIVLGTGASLNDLVEVVVYDVFSVADTVSKADGGTFDVAVSFAGAVTANAGVVVDTITIDAGEIDQSSGDLTLDVAGDLIIDTDGAEVKLKDGGTLYGKLHNNNPGNAATSLIVESSVQDQDILFKGNDGGSVVTALTLDMSAGGDAIFRVGATFGASILPSTDDSFDLGSSSLQWRDIYTGDINLNNTKTRDNEVDGTRGSWTIQEGDDNLFILNRLNGKKYKFKLEEMI